MNNYSMRRNYEDLVGAIVEQSVTDYRSAIRHLNDRNETSRINAERHIKEVELFLTSDWLPALSGIDGEYILARLRAETNAA